MKNRHVWRFFLCPFHSKVHFPFLYFDKLSMTVQEWFDKGCDYNQGVLIFSGIGKNKNLLKAFQRKETNWNREKLKYELNKFRTNSGQITDKSRTSSGQPKNSPANKLTSLKKIIQSGELTKIKSKPMSAYPILLHPVYQRRIAAFYKAASLKVQLNQLPEDAEPDALKLQFQIWEAVKENDKCWTILRHYDDTGRIMPTESTTDFKELSPQELVNQRQKLYVNKSKRAKTIRIKEDDLSVETNPAKRLKLEEFILKKKEELQAIENDIEQLTTMINDG